jgi:hypothetical protein
MNPWREREEKNVDALDATEFAFAPHPRYPTCLKEERAMLCELNKAGPDVPCNFVFSNGMLAQDFCLQYLIKHFFKKKNG